MAIKEKVAATHLALAYLVKKEGLQMRDLPFAGGPPAATALLGGHIDFFSASGSFIQFVKEGKFKLLLLFAKKRQEAFPDVPTIYDLGYDDIPFSLPQGFFAPKGITEEVRKTLERVFTDAIREKSYVDFLEKAESVLTYTNSADSEKLLVEQYSNWGRIVKELGLEVR